MEEISAEELKERLDRGDDFKLVMVLSEWAYQAKHIPGSLNITTPTAGFNLLKPEDDIVVYCSNPACVASQHAYNLLVDAGYKKVRRFSGGLEAWEDSGFPLEGDMVE